MSISKESPVAAAPVPPGGNGIEHVSDIKVRYSDMAKPMRDHVLTCCATVLWPQANAANADCADDLSMAEAIKKHMDGRYPCPWHCIVGRKFGSYVTHHQGFFIYLTANHRSVLLFKSI